ncbi:MAG: T9SS type A sorting domain-containing protein [Saprospiraceae bacterium]|nr:T9SS type A sorting domain-containing protein [Saprospiraceae bacterium]
MKKLYLSLLILGAMTLAQLQAQTRYYHQVFSGVNVTSNVPYGQNTTVLAYPTLINQPLIMDVYQPIGDTATARPVVLYLHTGNFLPFKGPDGSVGFNGACGGTLRDSSVIEACTRLAKMGYVACAVDYRLGWNPLAQSDVERRYGIINAAYRGIQDVRTCIRYFRRSVAEQNNPWKVDTDRITIWGQGTGGYLTLNCNSLDNYFKIPLASGGKFLWDHDQNPGTPPVPMVVPQVNGDIYGTTVGVIPGTTDTLSRINHFGYSSEHHLAINMAGAMADSAWVDPGQKPLISFHVPYDNLSPYDEGLVTVPGTNLQVVKVQGSYAIQQMQEAMGNNGKFIDNVPPLALEAEAAARTTSTPVYQVPVYNSDKWQDPTPGLYPFIKPFLTQTPIIVPSTTAPWEWSGPVPNNPTCNTDKSKALAYLDTVFQFVAPRACFALGIQSCINAIVSAKEPLAENINLSVAPNPATDEMRISSPEGETILGIEVYGAMGQVVNTIRNINSDNYTLRSSDYTKGTYYLKVSFKQGFVGKVVMFE